MLFRKKLRGKRIAALAADGFEQVELTEPARALRGEGATVDVVSLHGGKIRGMNLHEPGAAVRVDRTVDEVDPAEYHALLLPGGFINPDILRQSLRARELVRSFDDLKKPIATLCHGPWLLASADVVAGRQLTSWPGIRDDLVHAGAVWRDEEVVRDGNWVTSRGPQDLRAFVRAMIDLFAEEAPIRAEARPVWARSAPARKVPPAMVLRGVQRAPGPSVARRILGATAAIVIGGLAFLALRRATA